MTISKKRIHFIRMLLGRNKRLRRLISYVLILLMVWLLIWIPGMFYLKKTPPKYTSKWTLILPGNGSGATYNLESIGQASTTSQSLYSSSALSPKVSYKEISMSNRVIERAAAILGMKIESYGKPSIKLVDQTTLMYFKIKGGTAALSQRKAQAHIEAIKLELNALRENETKKREKAISDKITIYKQQLHQANLNLIRFQTKTGLASIEQLDLNVKLFHRLKQRDIELSSSIAKLKGKRDAYINLVGLTSTQAIKIFNLQSDVIYMGYVNELADTKKTLAGKLTVLGKNHPQVITQLIRSKNLQDKISERAYTLVGGINEALLSKYAIDKNENRDLMLGEMVANATRVEGLYQELIKNREEIQKVEVQIHKQREYVGELEDLIRTRQIAEAVLTSAITKIDTGKSDIFSSYPLIQVLDKPTLPDKPSSPNRMLVIGGCVFGSFSTLIMLVVLWVRRPIVRRILKSL